jgi:hypothetical protein
LYSIFTLSVSTKVIGGAVGVGIERGAFFDSYSVAEDLAIFGSSTHRQGIGARGLSLRDPAAMAPGKKHHGQASEFPRWAER